MLECSPIDFENFMAEYSNGLYGKMPLGYAFCLAFKVDSTELKDNLINVLEDREAIDIIMQKVILN